MLREKQKNEKMYYVIAGDTEKVDGCLVCPIGEEIEKAKERLKQMICNPNENDKELIRGHVNLRIESIKSSDAWWNDAGLCN